MATGASYHGTMTKAMRCKGERTSNAPTISQVAAAQAAHLWGSFERHHITLWYDNYRCYISGPDPRNLDKRGNVTLVVVLHTTELPQYLGLPSFDAVAQEVPRVVPILSRVLEYCYNAVKHQRGRF